MASDPSDDDDEPTAVVGRGRRSRDKFTATARDLRRVLASLPDDDETLTTPKVHDLEVMLRKIKADEKEDRPRQKTLRIANKPRMREPVARIALDEPADPAEPTKKSVPAVVPETTPLRIGKSRPGSRWPWAIVALLAGAFLLGAGWKAGVENAVPKTVRVSWDVAPEGAVVTIAGREHPRRGSGSYPCDAGLVVEANAKGAKPESFHFACGSEAIVRITLESAP